MIADRFGTFSPIFVIYTVMLLILSVPIFAMRKPVNPAEAESESRAAPASFVKARTA